MDNIGVRIKDIRKSYNMTQKDFGSKISVAQTYLSQIEKGERDATEKIIKLICFEFNVDENWLRTGEGVMEPTSDTFSLDDFAKQRQLSDLELDIIKIYLELDPDTRHGLLEHFKNGFLKKSKSEPKKVEEAVVKESNIKQYPRPTVSTKEDLSPPRVAESEVKYKYNVNNNIDIDAELASYRKQLESEQENKRFSVLPDSNLG